jgi:formylglycine-generating enzyme required for sulfatase activity
VFELLRRLLVEWSRSKRDLGNRMEHLTAVLAKAELDPTPTELAEVLWLAMYLTPTPSRRQRDLDAKPGPGSQESQSSSTQGTENELDSSRSLQTQGSSAGPGSDRSTALYPRSRGGRVTRSAHPLRAPAVSALPNGLAVARSLRSLHRTVASSRRRVLNEEATAQQLAEQRLTRQSVWYPVLERARERWFELALVIDRGPSMVLWQPLLADLSRILTYHGAFQSVRTWSLDTDTHRARLRLGGDRSSTRPCRPEELISPTGRRLVLVMSDAISRAWHSGSVNGMLRLWGAKSPTVVLQMLPQRMWSGTALGRGAEIRLLAGKAGSANTRLPVYRTGLEPVDADEGPSGHEEDNTLLRVPVLSLEPEALQGWANLLNGRSGAWVNGFQFDSETRYAASAADATPPEPDAAMIDGRVSRFFADASPTAQALAGYLSAAPLTLPVMRLVQQVMLPQSGQTHLAEVYVSGLLRRRSDVGSDRDSAFYDFQDGVRERLLHIIGRSEAVQVLQRVSGFVAEHTGQALDFQALLADPSTPGDLRLGEDSRYFATIAAKVLRRLGGEYRRLADRLEGKQGDNAPAPPQTRARIEAPTHPTVFRDPLLDGDAQGPEMVWLPGGIFQMGQEGSAWDDERPVHEVTLDTFSIGQYPVSFGEYDGYCKDKGRDKPSDEGWGRGARPVINVSWKDAASYCEWLSEQTGARYELLTEAQWEYACRAGGREQYSFGDDETGLGEYAWYDKNAGDRTHPVGEKAPNAWQLYDMHGNVLEWVRDWYSDKYYENSPGDNPSGPESGSYRVVRGGCWDSGADNCRSAYRLRRDLGFRRDYLGFRLSRTGPWSLDALTLARQRAQEQAAASEPGAATKPPYEPYQGFRDRLDGGDAPEMVYLPGGTFKMGDNQRLGSADERPVHEVTLDPYAMGRFPVAVGEYLRFAQATHGHYPEWLDEGNEYNVETGSDDYYRTVGMSRNSLDLPIVGVSWKDALAYCQWLSDRTGERYGLPTEAEWEYACRAGSHTAYCYGDGEVQLEAYAWYVNNAGGKAHSVGQKTANRFGLHDMHGNVWEWVRDWYSDKYYENSPSDNPSGPESGSRRVIRGGCWANGADDCRSADRNRDDPGYRRYYLGFRLSRRV